MAELFALGSLGDLHGLGGNPTDCHRVQPASASGDRCKDGPGPGGGRGLGNTVRGVLGGYHETRPTEVFDLFNYERRLCRERARVACFIIN